MRLIDADELLNKTVNLEAEARKQVANYEPLDNPKKWHIWNGVLAERTAFKYDLLDAPTVDAVPVVRCKDCKWGVDYYHEGDCYCLHPKWGLTYFDGSWKFYCADGERREDES